MNNYINPEKDLKTSIKDRIIGLFNKTKKIKEVDDKYKLIPNYLIVGFQEGMSRKDMMIFLRSKAEEITDINIAKYQIIKKDNGFYWEIHDSGSGHGILTDVIENIDSGPLVISTSKKNIKISKNKKGKGFYCIILNDDSEDIPTENISYKDKMKNIKNQGSELLLFSFIFSILGILSITMSLVFKYQILNQYEQTNIKASNILPYEKLSELEKIVNDKSMIDARIYAKKISLSSNKKDFVISAGKEIIEKDSAEELELNLSKKKGE